MKAEVIADPLATAEQLDELSLTDPLAALRHPNCPPEIWWELAELFPIQAKASVLFAMMTLAEPGRWAESIEAYGDEWIEATINLLSPDQARLFTADCMARVLSALPVNYPTEEHLRIAMDRWNRLGLGRDPVVGGAWAPWDKDPTQSDPRRVTHEAASEMAGKFVTTLQGDEWGHAYDAERKWQWERVHFYLGEEPPCL